jgi:hypothetical protein
VFFNPYADSVLLQANKLLDTGTYSDMGYSHAYSYRMDEFVAIRPNDYSCQFIIQGSTSPKDSSRFFRINGLMLWSDPADFGVAGRYGWGKSDRRSVLNLIASLGTSYSFGYVEKGVLSQFGFGPSVSGIDTLAGAWAMLGGIEGHYSYSLTDNLGLGLDISHYGYDGGGYYPWSYATTAGGYLSFWKMLYGGASFSREEYHLFGVRRAYGLFAGLRIRVFSGLRQ